MFRRPADLKTSAARKRQRGSCYYIWGMAKYIIPVLFLLVLKIGASDTWARDFVIKECLGNIETYDMKVIKPGVIYNVAYAQHGAIAQIRFAGREFEAENKKSIGNSWRGFWVFARKEGLYFSFLPDEGGTLKFEFEWNVWFSGSCK